MVIPIFNHKLIIAASQLHLNIIKYINNNNFSNSNSYNNNSKIVI